MRKRVWALLLALAVVVSLPCRAIAADSPIDFYQNVATALGIYVDLQSDIWQDKTKQAYLDYLDQNIQYSCSSITGIYASALKLEEITGLDIVFDRDGKLYISNDYGSGGAFNDIELTVFNYSSCLTAYMGWYRKAVNEGPTWPNGEGGTGQTPGGEPTGGLVAPIVFGNLFGMQKTSAYHLGPVQEIYSYPATQTTLDRLNDSRYQYVVGVRYFTINPSGNTGTSGPTFLQSASPITVSMVPSTEIVFTDSRWGNNGNPSVQGYEIHFDSESTMRGVPGNGSTWNAGTSYVIRASSPAAIIGVQGFGTSLGTSSGGGATDNTPPAGGGDILPIAITWPDLTYTGPTYNYTGNEYPTTSGDIDWSPVTDRLDAMADEFELYANSFESYRADFLSAWDALGAALQDVSGQITSLENRLQKVIDWLINIFNKLPSGAASTQPNPDTDEGGFWDWLGRLLDKLIGNLPEGVADFTSALSQLTGRFPFSVPWDLAALLGLFAHEPITPRATFYLPTVTEQGLQYDAQNAVPLVVDLTSFNDVASLARGLQYIVFAIALAKWSIDGMRGIDWTLFG